MRAAARFRSICCLVIFDSKRLLAQNKKHLRSKIRVSLGRGPDKKEQVLGANRSNFSLFYPTLQHLNIFSEYRN